MAETKIAILGAGGRMGCALKEALAQHPTLKLSAEFDRSGVTHTEFDVLVDFSQPNATLRALEVCERANKSMVIGTTGFTPDQKTRITSYAEKCPICMSGNFSTGVALASLLVEQAARVLAQDFDIEIVEAHHRHKVDAPSGTALLLGRSAATGAGADFDEQAIFSRHGHTGTRPQGSIGFSTIRGGDIVGDHRVMFLGDGEQLTISHRATSRLNFANGALRAARWVSRQAPGLYGIQDLLQAANMHADTSR